MTDRPDENYTAEPAPQAPEQPKKHSHRRIVLAAAVAVLVVLAAVFGFLTYRGVLAPASAAAKYDLFSYVSEDETTAYIENYKRQVGYSSATDEQWADYLANAGLTPASLRVSTIRQIIIDREVEKACKRLGLEADEAEVEQLVQNMKDSFAFGDDETWQGTLEMYGQTEEGLRDTYRLSLQRQALFQSEVPVPEPTDDELFVYLYSYYGAGIETKHIYYLTIEGLDEDGSYERLQNAQAIRKLLIEDGLNAENFSLYVGMYCTDSDLVSRGGANGWSLDMADYSSAYQAAVEDTEVGEVSPVFREENGYSFVWIDSSYTMPSLAGESPDEVDQAAYLADIPETLLAYFRDCAAQGLWESDCQAYLSGLYDASKPVLFPMPAGVPYYVDMSLATVDSADSGEDAAAGDGEGEGEAAEE